MRYQERGIAVVWMIGLLTVFGALAALTIDILRVQAMLRQAQAATEAAALAGARVLDSDVESYGRAKRFAIETLKQQRIGGLGSIDLSSLDFSSEGIEDPFEAALGDPQANPYLTNQAVLGPIRFVVERGAYWADGAGTEFTSFEGVGEGTEQRFASINHSVNYQGVPHNQVPVRYDVPVHLIANAVRVRAELTGIRAFFGSFVGLSAFGTMGRYSVAVSDSSVSAPVLPLAIPACALLLETGDTAGAGNYQFDTADFVPGKQCIRELMFTESDPLGPRPQGEITYPFKERAEGIARASSYDHRLTPRSLPLSGVLGVPESLRPPAQGVRPTDPMVASDFARLLAQIAEDGGTQARLGEYFVPVENGVFAQGLLNDTLNATRTTEAFETLISRGPSLLTLMPPGAPNAVSNFPLLRPFTELKDYYLDPTPNIRLRMREFTPRAPGIPEFVNPLCAHTGFFDKPLEERKALPVNVMVITPTQRGSEGVQHEQYCDYESVFEGLDQSSYPVFARTRPRVVGFVRANLFDFRFRRYKEDPLNSLRSCRNNSITCENPASPNPAGVLMRGVYTPFLEKVGQYVVEHRNWGECKMRAMRCSRPNPPPECPITCGSEPNPPNRPPGDDWEKMENCFDMPEYEKLKACSQRPPGLPYLQCLQIVNMGLSLNGFPPKPDITKRGNACLSLYNPECPHPPGDPRCVKPPAELEPQYGCGGVRARLDCGRLAPDGTPLSQRLISPDPATERRPMLIY